MRIHLRSFSWWLVLGVILLVVVPCVVVGLNPQRPVTGADFTFLVLDVENRVPMPGVTVYLYPNPRSLSGQIVAWLNVQQQVTGPDGKVKFTTAAQGSFTSRVEESPRYSEVPPLPGYRPPEGVNAVFFLARKAK